MKRDFSDFDLQARAEPKSERNPRDSIGPNNEVDNGGVEDKSEREEGITPEIKIQSGHVSDPGIGRKMDLLGSPQLKRSCSNIETKRVNKLLDSPNKTNSCDDLHNLLNNAVNKGMPVGIQGSPLSVKTSFSADKVMLKKRSSSQVLPSRSRKLWWKLFLWSHRNLHRPRTTQPQRMVSSNATITNKKGGYASDTIEASPTHLIDKKNKKVMTEPQNYQWVAFSAEASNLDRVNAWVNSLEDCSFGPNEDEGNANEDAEAARAIFYANVTEIGESSGGRTTLIVIPTISAFTSLRTVNLSGNFIVHISPGSLPKGLHALDLSRNKIGTIEGLRELTRLRVLNLSYNRISRIGQGLSNCTAIKELYLAGNKISEVEGLHRLLKLAVLDLSFNKITTAKALGQLVANYNSLLALNLLGNPIQSNIGDDQLRKAVSGLLPQLTYLNKQPIKPQRAREVATDSVAKAALGSTIGARGGRWLGE
uniref:Uncharacterized protein n=1 Tax=Ananas comosus var. bracteatus TaxID=296719 RepID=A0A6V7QWS8_ANACO